VILKHVSFEDASTFSCHYYFTLSTTFNVSEI